MYVRNRRTDRHHRFRRSGGSCYLSGDQEKEKIIPDCPKSPVLRKTGGCQKTAPLYYIFSCNLIQKLHRSWTTIVSSERLAMYGKYAPLSVIAISPL